MTKAILSLNVMTKLSTLVTTVKSNIIRLQFLCIELISGVFIHLLQVSIALEKFRSQHCPSF